MNPEKAARLIGAYPRHMSRLRGKLHHLLLPGSVAAGCRLGKGAFLDGVDRVELGAGVILGDLVTVATKGTGRIVIGAKTFVNAGSAIASTGEGIFIGDDTLFGPHVIVVDQNHNYTAASPSIARQGMSGGGRIDIGAGSWIAGGAVILGGTTLASNSVVGANAVVSGHFPRRCVLAGAPAKVVRYLDDQELTPNDPATERL